MVLRARMRGREPTDTGTSADTNTCTVGERAHFGSHFDLNVRSSMSLTSLAQTLAECQVIGQIRSDV